MSDTTTYRMATPDLLTGTTMFMQLANQLDTAGRPDMWPVNVPEGLRVLRQRLLEEEFDEYCNGEADDELVDVVDGLLDVIVVAWGTLLAYIGPDRAAAAAAEVVRSNLSKVDGSLGPIQYRADGKIVKPRGWTKPDIAGALS